MRVLVTGANGLLGHHLVRQLLSAGDRVRVLVRQGSNLRALEGLDVDRCYGDVRDPKALRAAADGCELVYHTAAVFAYVGYSRDEMFATAEAGARNAVDAAKDAGCKRLVLTSSTAVLGGNSDPAPLNEGSEANVEGMPDYLRSKALQEHTAVARARELALELVVVNPSMFIGPEDHRPSASLGLVTSYLSDPFKSCFKGGLCIAHVEDIAAGHRLLAAKARPYERHIVGAQNWTYRQIMQTIAELAGVRGPGPDVPKAVAYIAASCMELVSKLTGITPLVTRDMVRALGRYFWYDSSKAAALGFTARPSRQTLAETLAWLLTSPHLSARQKRRLRPADEVRALVAA